MPVPGAFQQKEKGEHGTPVAFFVTGPTGRIIVPEGLYLEINPTEMAFTFIKRSELIQTRGGWVEQHYGDEMDEIAGSIHSGAFMNIYEGLAHRDPYGTINYDKMMDLVELYRNNGCIYDINGNAVFAGEVLVTCDHGLFGGHFVSLSLDLASGDTPFHMTGSFSFKVTHPIFTRTTHSMTRTRNTSAGAAPVRTNLP